MDRTLPASNAEWMLEIAMVATLVRKNYGYFDPTVLPFVVPRAPRPDSPLAKSRARGAVKRVRKPRRSELGLTELGDAYLLLHVQMGYLSRAEARQISAYLEANVLPFANVMLELERATAAKPRAAAPAGSWLQIKITLADVKPKVWRRVVVPAELKLPVLHTVIQECMGWYDSHLHQFVLGGQRYAIPDEDDFEPPDGDERKLRLGELVGTKGDVLRYEYDFGDGWEHEVRVEKVLAEPPADGRIRCLAGANACPPEDVGGVPGYERLREALANPRDEEHNSYREWLGRPFDPKAFDLDAVNEVLARIKPPARLRVAGR